jgi:hypothetical protein
MITNEPEIQKTRLPHGGIAQSPQSPQDIFIAAGVFLIYAFIFGLLRSKDIFAVDGAFRCLEVYQRSSIFFHDNNHMLYPVNVFVWSRLAGVLGFGARTREGFFPLVELMNCLAAAASLTIVFYLTKITLRSVPIAFCVTAGLAFSRAFLLHATNSAEPMVAVFWSLLAIAFAALAFKTRAGWPIIASGFFFALAMATYRSTIFLAPAAIVLILESRTPGRTQTFLSRPRLVALGQLAFGGLVGCLCIYGWVFWRLGIQDPREMLVRFFVQRDTRVYLGAGIGKLLNLPIGLVRNVFLLQPHYVGIRNLLVGPRIPTIMFLLLVATVCVLLVAYTVLVIQTWNRLSAVVRTAFIASGVGFLSSTIPLALWEANYDKLWLQPLGCLAVLLGISATVVAATQRSPFILSKAVPALLLAGVLSNTLWAVRSHSAQIPDFSETERLSQLVAPRDLLVGGWDRLTTLYGYGWAETRVFAFPSEAVVDGATSVQRLHEQVIKTHQAGGKVYFLDLLDMPQGVWDSFLGSRCGVPYSALDFYRAHASAPLANFQNWTDAPIALRRLDLPE